VAGRDGDIETFREIVHETMQQTEFNRVNSVKVKYENISMHI